MSDGGKRADKSGDASFLSRWARRKAETRNEPVVVPDNALSKSSTGGVAGTKMPETPLPERTLPAESQAKEELPAIDSLTHEADFSPFMAKDVDPGLRNQAMKKLFTDPHYQFEQMDKLDIYIDDYSKPDPIPLDMLRKMYQSKSLGLFDDEEEDAAAQAAVTAGEVDVVSPADSPAAITENSTASLPSKAPVGGDAVPAEEESRHAIPVPPRPARQNAG